MTNKSKLGALGFIAAIGLASALASSAFAATPYPNYGGQNYAPTQSGGGSGGYNQKLETYRLKGHHNNSQGGTQSK
ncbi:MAG TPA: hypothetical protein VMF12_15765 [Xanthobacteraceae bacterium]|nr:hypothetical protein [Xanthobacteraceae bacterium]